VAGYGIYSDAVGNSQFIANVNRFAVTTPETSIALRVVSTTYAVGAIARVDTEDSKTLVCKIGGTTGTGALTVGAIGTIIADGTVRWQVASRVPFAVQSVPTSIGGVSVPAGVYIDAAYVLNATIQNAQIAALAVDDTNIVKLGVNKLTAGSISVGEYIQSTNYVAGSQGWKISGNGFAEFGAAVIRGQLTAAQIDTRNLTIRDSSGNVLFGSGTNLNYANITASSGWLNSNITLNSNGTISGAGGGSISLSGLGAGAFATLSQITEANISTYIEGAAIDTAYIKNLAVTTALIDNLAVTGAKIDNLAVTSAKIDNLAVTTAKIGDAEVSTLKIAGNAVTLPGGANGVYSASVTLTAPIAMQFMLISTYTQGLGRNGQPWTLAVDGAAIQTDLPAQFTLGAMSALVSVAAGSHIFSMSTTFLSGDAACGITVLGVKR
jgi:hypothetical protein